MSTVAYANGIMAADTQATMGDEPMYGVTKIGKTNQFLFGFAGRLSYMIPMFHFVLEVEDKSEPERWYQMSDLLPNMDNDGSNAMLVDREGRIYGMSTDGFVVNVTRNYEAIGSGAEYAMGALTCNRSAVEALEVSKMFDVMTGGDIMALSFDHHGIIAPSRPINA